jgi:hypothetical protein
MPTENKLKLNGGEFLLKESLSNEIFTPEDFSEEQLMMKQTIVDFMDREIWPDKMKYEEKNYDLTVQAMKKIGDLGLLGVSLEEKYGGMGMDFVLLCLQLIMFQDVLVQLLLLTEHKLELQSYLFIYMVMKIKNKNTCLNLLLANGLDPIV